MVAPNNLNKEQQEQYAKAWWNIFDLVLGTIKFLVLAVCFVLLYSLFDLDDLSLVRPPSASPTLVTAPTPIDEAADKIENGIHIASGLYVDNNFELVRANCTACHSGKLIAQNRATRAGWEQMIRWMQATQGLWDLGNKESRILDYLEKYYAPQEVGRRTNLDIATVEWYLLNLEE